MKTTILSLVFLAFVGFAFADNEGVNTGESAPASATAITLTGQIVDFCSGEALTGAEVQIEGTDIKAYTDFDGNFEIPNIVPGEYNIIASYISYEKSLVENFKIQKEESKIDIKLQISK